MCAHGDWLGCLGDGGSYLFLTRLIYVHAGQESYPESGGVTRWDIGVMTNTFINLLLGFKNLKNNFRKTKKKAPVQPSDCLSRNFDNVVLCVLS